MRDCLKEWTYRSAPDGSEAVQGECEPDPGTTARFENCYKAWLEANKINIEDSPLTLMKNVNFEPEDAKIAEVREPSEEPRAPIPAGSRIVVHYSTSIIDSEVREFQLVQGQSLHASTDYDFTWFYGNGKNRFREPYVNLRDLEEAKEGTLNIGYDENEPERLALFDLENYNGLRLASPHILSGVENPPTVRSTEEHCLQGRRLKNFKNTGEFSDPRDSLPKEFQDTLRAQWRANKFESVENIIQVFSYENDDERAKSVPTQEISKQKWEYLDCIKFNEQKDAPDAKKFYGPVLNTITGKNIWLHTQQLLQSFPSRCFIVIGPEEPLAEGNSEASGANNHVVLHGIEGRRLQRIPVSKAPRHEDRRKFCGETHVFVLLKPDQPNPHSR